MNSKVGKNYLYNILYEIVALLAPLVTTPHVSRALGAEGIGLYSRTYSVITIFVLFSVLGTTVYGRREIAFVQNDRINRSNTFWQIFVLRILTTLIIGFIFVGYVLLLAKPEDRVFLFSQFAYILATIFDVTWFFQGIEDFKSIALRNIIVKVIGVLFVFIFVNNSEDLYLYIVGLAIIAFVSNVSLVPLLVKYVRKPEFMQIHPLRSLHGSFQLFIPTIASQVYLVLDKIMLGSFTTTNVQNGYYEQAQKIIMICWTFVTTFITVMTPRFANIFAKGNSSDIRCVLKKSYRTVWLISSPIVFGLIAIASNIVPWFFGEEFLLVTPLLYIFSTVVFAVGLSGVSGSQYLVVAKKQGIYTGSIIIGAIINFVLNLFMIPRLYSIGAAVASVVAEWVIAIIQVWYITCREQAISIRELVFSSKNYIASSIVMFAVVKSVSMLLNSSLLSSMVLASVGACVYAMLLLVLRDPLVVELKDTIIRKTSKK